MAVEIKNDDVVFSIPNSEAIIEVQRNAIKMRSVGSYYLSGMQDNVEKALNNLEGNFYIDLLYSYIECNDCFKSLAKELGYLYRGNLSSTLETLKSIEWIKDNYPNQLFDKVPNPVILESRKYLKIPGRSDILIKFKYLCLGDITEIVFQRLSVNTFRIFVRPKKDIKSMLKTPEKLIKYFDTLKRGND